MYVEKQRANHSQDSAEEKSEGRLHHQNPGLLKGLINTVEHVSKRDNKIYCYYQESPK